MDWVELLTEEWLPVAGLRAVLLDEVRQLFPMAIHGTEMSIGSADGLDRDYLDRVAGLADRVGAPWFSDHMCFTHEAGIRLGHLTPIAWNKANALRIAEKAKAAQEHVGRPFLIENISYHFVVPDELTEGEFFNEVLTRADCYLLLDVTNVYTNAVNLGFDPFEAVSAMPLERVVEIHLAGGRWQGGFLEDSHDAPVAAPVWELLEFVLGRVRPAAVLLERDAAFPASFEELAEDLGTARDLLRRSHVLPAHD